MLTIDRFWENSDSNSLKTVTSFATEVNHKSS